MIICEHHQEMDDTPCASYLQGGFCKSSHFFRCTEYLREREPEISHSSIKDFSRCRRAFWYSYIVGLELIDLPIPMLSGHYLDLCLTSIHSGHGIPILDLSRHLTDEGRLSDYLEAMLALVEAYYTSPDWFLKGTPQQEFHWLEDGYPRIHGYLDLYTDTGGSGGEGWEFKYTQRPESYTKFTLQDQLGTYFLGMPEMKKMTVRTFTVPLLRLGKKEENWAYHERVLNDVHSRPKHYVRDTSYYRNEFDLEAIKARSLMIMQDIKRYLDTAQMTNFFQTISPGSCFLPSPCSYLSICESGVISDLIYRKRERR